MMKTKYFAFTGDSVWPLEGAKTFDEGDEISDTMQKQGVPVFYIFDRKQLASLIKDATKLLKS